MFTAVRTQFTTDPPTHRPTETPKHRNTDRQIDRLVYDLYGLTEDEIALVEGA